MKKPLPLVSIVLPAYNHGKYLHEAIQSVLLQTYPYVELLVFDDGSTDDTPDILASYGKQFYWESHKNIGQSATLNKGWKMSKGAIISYLSADDVLEPLAVETAVNHFHLNNDILVYGDYSLIDAESNVIGKICTLEYKYSEMISKIIVQPGPGVFFYKKMFDKIGGWDESLHQIPDYDYWIRLGLLGEFSRIPKLLARYRVHEKSQSYINSNVEGAEECVKVINKYFMNKALPREILAMESKAKSFAHLIVARHHLIAGRYVLMLSAIKKAWGISILSIFSLRMIQLLGNGIVFRIRRLISEIKN